jgi:hypothetical protein
MMTMMTEWVRGQNEREESLEVSKGYVVIKTDAKRGHQLRILLVAEDTSTHISKYSNEIEVLEVLAWQISSLRN